MRRKWERPKPQTRALIREVKAKALVKIDREDSHRVLSRALTVRFDENKLRAPAVTSLLKRPGLSIAGIPALFRDAVAGLLRGITERILVGPVLRRLPLVRDRIRALLGAGGRAAQELTALGTTAELAAVTAAAACDPSQVARLLILVWTRPAAPGDPAAALVAELVTLLIADPDDRQALVPAPPPPGRLARLFAWWPWWSWNRRGPRWRRARILLALERCGFRLGDSGHNAGRFFEGADYMDVVTELVLLFMELVPPGSDDDPRRLPGTEEEFFALLLDRLWGAGPTDDSVDAALAPLAGTPHIGGFTEGSDAPPPSARLELARWYWDRAPVLDAFPELKIRKLDRIERDVVGLRRVQTRETVSHGMTLARPLRHRPFRPADDDPSEIDFSHVLVSPNDPIFEQLSFGVGRAHPAVPVPVERRWTTLRETKRREIALVEIEFDVAKLALGSDLFDQLLFVRDSSGSMGGFDVGTPLDWVTLGVFSVLKTMEARGLTHRFRYGAIDFSNATTFSGFVPWDRREDFDRVLLTEQNGGTSVDVAVVRSALSGPDRTLVLFLSDGDLSVRGGLERELVDLLKQHKTTVVASAGQVSHFCRTCADAGITTLLLDSIDQVGPVFLAIATNAGRS